MLGVNLRSLAHRLISHRVRALRYTWYALLSLKDHLTPIAGLEGLDPAALATLRSIGVTTVEELAGMMEADLVGVARMIGFSPEAAGRLLIAARSIISDDNREAFMRSRVRKYPLGALDPSE